MGGLFHRAGLVAAVGLAGLLLCAPGAGAATITVTTTTDELDGGFGDTGCSLREAVQAANTNTPFPGVPGCPGDNAGHDTILLQSGLEYTLVRRGEFGDLDPIDDDNSDGDLDIAGGGGLTIRSTGPGLAIVDGGNEFCPCGGADRVIEVLPNAGNVRLERLEVTHGLTNAGPDHANESDGGGGILNQANLTIVDSEIVENVAVALNAPAQGGGIFNRNPQARLTMSGSTVADNTVASGTAVADGRKGTGGGIASYTTGIPVDPPDPLGVHLTNVTISGNDATFTANNSGQIGGIFTGDNSVSTPTTLTSVTITGNDGTLTGGMQVFDGTASGTIVAGNTDFFTNFPDCAGFPTSLGGNILGTRAGIDACSFNFDGPNDLIPPDAANPVQVDLGNLIDNGGLTRTHAPNAGSPAINRGGPCPSTDQRGFFRAPVAPCDSGSVEVGAPASLPVTPATPGPTGLRADALKKCKKKKGKKKRKKCRKRAQALPV